MGELCPNGRVITDIFKLIDYHTSARRIYQLSFSIIQPCAAGLLSLFHWFYLYDIYYLKIEISTLTRLLYDMI